MAADKKISELEQMTISDIENISQQIYVPVVCNGTNSKLDLKSVIQAILSKISAITPYENTTSPSESVDSETISTINGRINAVENRIGFLETESTWPKLGITLTDGTRQVPYLFKTCPNGGDTDIVINTSNITPPNFYVVLNAYNPVISGGVATITGRFTITNEQLGLALKGGQIGTLTVTGSAIGVTSIGTSTLTLPDWSTSLSNDSNYYLSQNGGEAKTVDITITYSLPQGIQSIQSITLNGTVNGISVSGSATYSVPNQSGSAASGYITLQNGS